MAKNTPDRIIDTPETPTAGRASLYTAGATSDATTTADHTHDGTAQSGGVTLTAVTTAWSFLLLSATATMQAALNRLDSYGMFVKTTVQSGVTLTIPSGYQQIVRGPYTVTGDIVVTGDLIIL